MKFLRCFIVTVALIITGNMMAQSQIELGQLMRERGEYYFTLNVNEPSQIQTLSKICSVDGTDGKTVVAYANQKEYDELLKAGFQPNLQTPPSLRANVTMWDGNGTYNWDSYLTYTQYVSMMEAFPSQAISGRTCTLFSLGTLSTSNHRQLLGVRINNGSPEGKPKFLYTSTMHGDEITGMILMLRLINELCTNTTDNQIANLVNNLDIYIMPLTNPDGTYKGGNNTVNSAQRYNGNNVDLNRNYKDYYKGNHPDGNNYEEETIWTMAMGDENLFTMSANYHGGAEVMNYPWDAVYDDPSDTDWFEYVCSKYVQIARQKYSSYMTDTYSDGVTNGADWYVITGSRQDYMNAYAQCREVTVECSTTKTPAASQLPNFWNYNRNAMLAFMEQCLYGVHGFVYDAVTGASLEGVTVTVENHDSETSYVTSHSVGDFHRPIKGGTYTFTFAKQGYYPESVQVTVADDDVQNLTVYLNPNLNLNADFTASTTDVSLGQSISFTDTSEGMVSSWSWAFEGASPSTSTEQNPTGIVYNTPGDYDVTLIITGPTGISDTLTKEDYIHVTESILMQNGEVTTCSGLFYDPSGPDSNYGNSLNYTMTFYPETEGAMISVTFYEFDTESGYDYLYIYDGASTSATQIGLYDGTDSPGTVTATNSDGALTFKFTSDRAVVASGWAATVSCVMIEHNITATADPVEGGTVTGGGTFSPGETCTLTATPAEGYRFIHWTENDEVVSTDTVYSFTVTIDRDLVAVFGSTTPISITISANPERAGSVSGGGEFLFGETCTVTATPNEGYSFANWTEDGEVVSTEATYSFEVTQARELVANFNFDAAVTGKCYYTVTNTEITAGAYVMGNLNGETLAMLSQENTSVTATTATVALTDYGFSVDEETTLSQVTLQAYDNEQYYIKYGNYYLVRSSYYSGNSSLSWSTNSNSGSRWHINANGIYVSVSSGGGYPGGSSATNYYLYYDNGFKLSTSVQNNITFYTEGDCPELEFTITATAEPAEGGIIEGADVYYQGETCTLIATANEGYTFVNWTEDGVEVSSDIAYTFTVTAERNLTANFAVSLIQQTVDLVQGWNWFSTYLEIELEDLQNALVAALPTATSMDIKSSAATSHYTGSRWRDTGIFTWDVAGMYMINVPEACQIELTGTPINPADHPITIEANKMNWIGFPFSESLTFEVALPADLAVDGDMIKTPSSTVKYNNNRWRLTGGGNPTFEPNKGYIYDSKASSDRILIFQNGN